MVLRMVEMEVADPDGPERSGSIAHGLPTPSSGRTPDPSTRGGRRPRADPTRPPAGRSSPAAPSSTSSAPRRSARTASPASPAGRSTGSLGRLGLGQPGHRVHLGDGARHRARPDRRLRRAGRGGRPPGRLGGPLRDPPGPRPRGRPPGDPRRRLRFQPGGDAARRCVRVDPTPSGQRDLADSGTDVA